MCSITLHRGIEAGQYLSGAPDLNCGAREITENSDVVRGSGGDGHSVVRTFSFLENMDFAATGVRGPGGSIGPRTYLHFLDSAIFPFCFPKLWGTRANVCENVRKCAKAYESERKCAKVCESVRK